MVCADEEAERMARDLSFLTGGEVPVLAARSFLFHNIATVSPTVGAPASPPPLPSDPGEIPCLVATVEALLQRTLPPEGWSACAVLEVGQTADLEELTAHLTQAGYVRCEQVEGPGQFALRGGILDVYSPAMEAPVRAEFFGDEVDALGIFDPGTQRRTANVWRRLCCSLRRRPCSIWPPAAWPKPVEAAGPALRRRRPGRPGGTGGHPPAGPGGGPGGRGAPFPVADRYLPPNLSGACHRGGPISPMTPASLFSGEQPGGERAKTWQWQLEGGRQDPAGAGESWMGPAGRCPAPMSSCAAGWRTSPLPIWTPSPCPPIRRPRCVLSLMAKQLPLLRGPAWRPRCRTWSHYQSAGFSVLVLVSSEQRALNLQTLLREAEGEVRGGLHLKSPAAAGTDPPHCGRAVRGWSIPG